MTQGLVLLDGGENKSQVFSDYKQSELVGHWNLDDNQSSSVALNSTGNSLLNGNITNPLRVPGVKGNAFLFDGIDDRIVVNNSPALHLDQYSVSFWINPERNDEYWTGVFGRSGRNYAIWLGDSNHPNRPFIHHRFGEGDNVNEGINNFNLNSWGEWHHVVCSNGGIGGVARTYVNGSFFSNNQRFERKILDNLIKDLTAPLNIGVDPQNINSNSQYFLGKLDEIRFYNIPLGSEDVYHLFKGDPALITYSAPSTDAFDGSSGSLSIITTPALPVITPPLYPMDRRS